MSNRIVTVAMVVLLLALGLLVLPGTGCSLIPDQTTSESELDVTLLEEVWEIIQERYVAVSYTHLTLPTTPYV